MKFSQVSFIKFLFMPRSLALLLSVGMMAFSINAQKTEAPMANPDLDQCANGPAPAAKLPCTGSNWQNGNLNSNNSQYVEGESVTYRAINTGGTSGGAGSLTIEYDTTKAGKRAIDYLTTYDRSNPTGNDPCDGVTGCSLGTFDIETIPIDADVTNGPNGVPGGGDDIAQVAGNFTLFGGTITSVSAYSLSGSYAGDSTRSITVNFTFGPTGTVVLAWSGHISRRVDWGVGSTAIAISGAPYHTEVGGSQCSMQVESVIVPATVAIVKRVAYGDPCNTGVNDTSTCTSSIAFGFTASANYGTSPFTIVDGNSAPGGGGNNTNSSIIAFGSANSITVTEDLIQPGGFSLAELSCVEVAGGIPLDPGNGVTSWNLGTRTATIVPDEASFITCTFSNTQLGPSAAPASVSGRVTTATGNGIRGAVVTIENLNTGETRSTTTGSFGYYTIEDLPSTDFYVLTVGAKRFRFANGSVSFTLNDSMSGLDFVANP